MAANPLIALQTRVPDIGRTFSNTLLNLGRINQLQRSRSEQPARNRILEAQAQTAEAGVPTSLETLNRADKNRIQSVVNGASIINRLPQEDRLAAAQNRRSQLISDAQISGKEANTEDTDLYISKLEQNDFIGAQKLIDDTLAVGQQYGIIEPDVSIVAGAKTKEAEQKQVNVLRKSISDITKTFRTTEEATKRIRSVGNKGTASSDMALVFSFMKILDPGSTVREGEFATARDAAGVPQRIINLYNNARDGTILSDTQRTDFLNQAESLFNSQRESTDNQIENVLEQADQDEITRSRVFGKTRLSEFDERRGTAPPLPQIDLTTVTEQDIDNMSQEQLQALDAQLKAQGR